MVNMQKILRLLIDEKGFENVSLFLKIRSSGSSCCLRTFLSFNYFFPLKFNSAAFCTEDYLKAKFDILNPTISELSENRKGTEKVFKALTLGMPEGTETGGFSSLRTLRAQTCEILL